jgi:hypothetical protein
MPLKDLDLPVSATAAPGDVHAFLREAGRRVERFRADRHTPGFVPSDFEGVYRVLRALAAAAPAPGGLFCEWGSGFGVVACLAALLEFDACGIEIDGALVDEARQLAGDFDLPVEFVHGSFIPEGGEAFLAPDDRFAWLTTDAGGAHEQLGLDPDDFNVIFAYPWPDEERATEALFRRYAAVGAVLVTYHGGEDFRVRRKLPGR